MQCENPTWLVLLIYVIIIALGIFLIYKLTKDRTKKVSTLRLFIQVVAVVAIFMGLIIGPFNVPAYLPLGPITARSTCLGLICWGTNFQMAFQFLF